MNVLVVGHLPPPITGENIIRGQLVEVLRQRGWTVLDVARGNLGVYWKGYDALVIINGQSRKGMFFDLAITFWGLWRCNKVYWCFHNFSWRLLGRVPQWCWLGRGKRISAVVSRPAIASYLQVGGYAASVLDNCIEAEFEAPRIAVWRSHKRLLWLSRPDVEKGFLVALEAFALLWNEDHSWCFDVYGADLRYAQAHGFDRPGVLFHGFVSGGGKVDAFDAGGVFILPSRYKNETQPLSIIEAMACGVPIVASDIGGIPEMLDGVGEHAAGVSLGDGTAADYAAAVSLVVADYDGYSAAARRVYQARFSREVFQQRVRALFN